MQLPRDNAHYLTAARCAHYVARRLRRTGRDLLETDTVAAATKLRTAGRAYEDTDVPIQNALADRDGTRDNLHAAARGARASLAGRSASATKQEPYILIFAKGLKYFTAATFDEEEESRYRELIDRLVAYLPASDPVRTNTIPVVETAITDFIAASAELARAERAATHARTELSRAQLGVLHQIEKVYGLLVAELGKAQAEAFFPRKRRPKVELESEPVPSDADD